jgi:hypothetical protein
MSSSKLLDQVRITVRLKHFSSKTERAYIHWIKRFILLANAMRAKWVSPKSASFLGNIAIERHVSAGTPDRRSQRPPLSLTSRSQMQLPGTNQIERA